MVEVIHCSTAQVCSETKWGFHCISNQQTSQGNTLNSRNKVMQCRWQSDIVYAVLSDKWWNVMQTELSNIGIIYQRISILVLLIVSSVILIKLILPIFLLFSSVLYVLSVLPREQQQYPVIFCRKWMRNRDSSPLFLYTSLIITKF